MSELINDNTHLESVFTDGVFASDHKFVDFAGLDYFWGKAKEYINGLNTAMDGRVSSIEATVGDSTKGLVQKVNLIQAELDGLSGGAGSITSQIENAINALDLPNTYEAKGEAAKALSEAKTDAETKANAAEAAAKEYVDGRFTNEVTGKFDTVGSAAAAEAAAKSYADDIKTELDGKIGLPVDGETPATGLYKYIDDQDAVTLNAAKADATSKASAAEAAAKSYADGKFDDAKSYVDGIIGVPVDGETPATGLYKYIDDSANDAASSAVATVLDGAPEKFDTLKEIANWIGDVDTASTAAELVTRVKALEDVKDAYKDADTTLEANLKSYADGIKTELDGKIGVPVDGETPATGLYKYIDDQDKAILDAAKADATSKANAAEAAAKSYADGVKTELDGKIGLPVDGETPATGLYKYIDDQDAVTLNAAKEYVDGRFTNEVTGKFDTVGSAAAEAAKAEANAKADTTTKVGELKTYVDTAFASIVCATSADIDSLFA